MGPSTISHSPIRTLLLARQSQKKLPNRHIKRRMQRNRGVEYDRTLTRHRKQLPQPTSPNGLACKTPKLKNTKLSCSRKKDCRKRTSTDDHSPEDRGQSSFIVLFVHSSTSEKPECSPREISCVRKKRKGSLTHSLPKRASYSTAAS